MSTGVEGRVGKERKGGRARGGEGTGMVSELEGEENRKSEVVCRKCKWEWVVKRMYGKETEGRE